MPYRNLHILLPTTTLHRAFVGRGIDPARCHLIRPGVDFSRIRRRRDPDLRRALGFNNDDHVFLTIGESTRPANHRLAIWAIALIHETDRHAKILSWGRGDAAPSLAAFGASLRRPGLFRDAQQALRRPLEFEDLLPAADTLLITASGIVPTLPISIAMAAALPIVSTVTSTISELLEDRHTALMTGQASPQPLARRILDLRDDPTLQWRLADTARTEAYQHCSLTRSLDQHRTLYQQLVTGHKEIGADYSHH